MRRLGGPLGVWRLGVLLLAAGFWAHQFALQDLAVFGWQFRYLTVWALTLGLVAGALTFRSSLAPGAGASDSLLLVAAALAGMQAILYWAIRLEDPEALRAAGAAGGPLGVAYLHVVMPVLVWVETVFLSKAARGALAAACWLIVTLAAYMLWIEAAVAPLNVTPAGLVTAGLPYPFLNEMTQGARGMLYLQAAILGLVLLALARWAAGRTGGYPPSEERSEASPSR